MFRRQKTGGVVVIETSCEGQGNGIVHQMLKINGIWLEVGKCLLDGRLWFCLIVAISLGALL